MSLNSSRKNWNSQSKSKKEGNFPKIKNNINTISANGGTSKCSGDHKDSTTKGYCKNNSISFNIPSELLLFVVYKVE